MKKIQNHLVQKMERGFYKIMRRMKFISCFVFVLFCSVSVFAGSSRYEELTKISNDTSGLPAYSKNTKILDMPLAGGITSFANTIEYFSDVVIALCILGAFLMILFNSFKLWFSAIEVKKSFVDMVYKCVFCSILVIIYKPCTNAILKYATEFGASCSGGYDKINSVYSETYKVLLGNIEKGIATIKTNILNNAFKTSDGNSYITEETIKDLFSYGMSQSEIDGWIKEKNLKIAKPNIVRRSVGARENETASNLGVKRNDYEQQGWLDENGNVIKTKSWFFGISSTLSAKKLNNKLKEGIDSKKQLEYITKINALTEVLSGESIISPDETADTDVDSDIKKKKDRSFALLKDTFYAPYLKDANGENTFFLSPSAVFHTCQIMSDCIAYACAEKIDPQTGEIEKIKFNPGGVWSFDGIIKALTSLLYKMGMIIATIILMAEYTITILEFYLVRALGTLLIPLFFIDATKSFAQNLIRLFLSYFMKILVTVLCCFFSLGLFMDISVFTYTDLDLSATFTLVIYLSTIVTGLMLALNASKIASTVMNGQPSMGVGDLARVGHSMAHAAHSAQHMAHSAGQFGQGAVHAGQNMAKGAAGAFQTLDSIHVAGRNAGAKIDAARDSGQWSGTGFDRFKAQAGAAASVFKQSVGQKIGDAAHKAAFGTERHHLDENGDTQGFWKVGQQVMVKGHQRAATAEDVKKHNTEIALKNAEKSFNKSLSVNEVKKDQDRPYPWPELNGH